MSIAQHTEQSLFAHLPRGETYAEFRPAPGRTTLPDIYCELVWTAGRLDLLGPMSRARPCAPPVGEPVRMLSLDPLVARAWLGVPIEELTDRRIPLADISPHLADPMSEAFARGLAPRLTRLRDPQQLPKRRETAARAILRRGGTVQSAAAAVNVSERQLERLFADRLGLGPKLYARIVRFRHAVRLARAGANLADAAAAAGYVDQPHFNRDMRALVGQRPTVLLPHVGIFQYTTGPKPY